jgi:DNA repair protein RadC
MNIRLKKDDPIRILNTKDVYSIMQKVLLRENKIDRNREHLWTISMDGAYKILNIELVSLGSINKTIAEPMEVFSVPLQKRSVRIIVIHNHPSGELQPSAVDKDITDRLIQCGLMLNVRVLDHLIISEKSYYSFADSGLLAELEASVKYVPAFKIEERFKKAGDQKARAMVKVMKQNGESIEKIMQYTGLSKQLINRIKG